MKPRFLDAMGEALNLVRNSNLAEATALLRKALSGEEARGPGSDPEARPQLPPGSALAPSARRPLGEVLRALRARRPMPPDPADAPDAPDAPPAHDFGERFASRTYRGPAGSLNYRLYVPADHRTARPRVAAHAAWMHAKSGGFRFGNADERFGRRVRSHRRLSTAAAARESVRLLELVRQAPSEPRIGRAG